MNMSLALQTALSFARREAQAAHKDRVDAVQMFCGVTKLVELAQAQALNLDAIDRAEAKGFVAENEHVASAFKAVAVDTTMARRSLRGSVGKGRQPQADPDTIPRSDHLRSIFDRAAALAAGQPAAQRVELSHLLAAMLEHREQMVTRYLADQGVDIARLREVLVAPAQDAPARAGEPASAPAAAATPALDRFGRDLTALAEEGRLGPVIGRRSEVLQVIQTLARRSKNNAVLVGEAGVGKTAVAELLAIRIAAGRDGEVLRGHRLIEVTMSGLMAGASHVGEREERLEAIVRECRANPNIILFIDEMHTIMKAGGVGGAIDPADILKPALARGEIRCLGATTQAEYVRYIEADAALERRFERIRVDEPTSEDALEILRGVAPGLEAHHGLSVPDSVLKDAVAWSVRFDAGHQLPDKALDLIDKAAARARFPALSIIGTADSDQPLTLSSDTLAHVLADKLGIPVDLIRAQSASGFDRQQLVDFLGARLVGQDEAIARIATRLEVARSGLRQRSGPLGVFLFMGPTGVGKTEMAKCLAEYLFGDRGSLIRLDMSEYMEEHSVARLIGAPPGYVGHDEGGQLANQLRANPYSIVLLDEVEKAHPRVFDMFLQLFDEGRLTDAKGRTSDARHAIFIMTSNVSAQRHAHIGFQTDAVSQADLSALQQTFRPEFLNRIDELIAFNAIELTHAAELIARSFAQLRDQVHERHGKVLEIEPAAIDLLGRLGFHPQYGVRDLQRVLEEHVDVPLGRFLRTDSAQRARTIRIGAEAEQLRFSGEP